MSNSDDGVAFQWEGNPITCSQPYSGTGLCATMERCGKMFDALHARTIIEIIGSRL